MKPTINFVEFSLIMLQESVYLRFGEHDIRLIRKQLHLAVEEELGFTEEEKEIRKRLMDKVHFLSNYL